MLRDATLQEISDGRLYRAEDIVKADCQGCAGCSDCCRGMEDTVVLDPLDLHRLREPLGMTPEQIIYSRLELGFCDGLLLPHLPMKGREDACVFLNEEGRCSIHPFRPGFCRMFPLGRYYEGDDFYYILQIHECPNRRRTKVKVKKWLDTPDLRRYEAFVRDWHNFLRDVRLFLSEPENEASFENMNKYILARFYLQAFDPDGDFYEEFSRRLAEARGLL